jgi:prepilin-type N-terminal cleavage/methylation domain-containing protein/prepilin-type processing-associated H-X9-DG protein
MPYTHGHDAVGRVSGRRRCSAFTLIELLTVVALVAALVGIILPAMFNAKEVTRRAVCAANLRSTHMAMVMYFEQNNGRFFPYRESKNDGTLWYWGFEQTQAGAQEGTRPIDQSKARLAPYISQDGRNTSCPSFPRDYPGLKPKFNLSGYGFAINRMMTNGADPGTSWQSVRMPGETIAWADSAQVNTFQAPASPGNPMLEEWYYLDNRQGQPANFHFRHATKANAAFADSSVRTLAAVWLDQRCDRLVGRPEPAAGPAEISHLLKIVK